MNVRISIRILFIINILTTACRKEPSTLFTKLSESKTGITFRNLLKEEDPNFNIILYPYFYNGGGVAIGDLNNDGLPDIFFTGNMVKNRLFMNKGDWKFEDVTTKSGLAEKEGWCTGATIVDINEDGWLDIYICRSGLSNVAYRKNLLFINNHDLTFTESASAYGLDDPGYSTQASFFDYDKDGDLDMFLINQSAPEYSRGQHDYIQQRNLTVDSSLQNKLFRNDGGKFTEVTRNARITSTVFSFSLGVSTCDINQDGWPDIYVANDFKEPDYYHINNGDGTFTNVLAEATGHNSLYSMGIDVADYNNDLLPDIMVLDMLAESNYAQKMHMGGDNYTQYAHLFRNGMFPQYMKNSLQKNNGNGTFSEIAQLAGVSNTDWSWSPLFADYDNDGYKDLFVTNGYKRDNTDIQFVVYSMNQSLRMQKGAAAVSVPEYISHMPGIHTPNYIYKNVGKDRFENKIKTWGFDHNTFSHGAAYADLDNDGDLDLIVNNTDAYAGVYRNNTEKLQANRYLKIQLKGDKKNPAGIGTKIYAYAGGDKFYLEQNPVRGYQSSVDLALHLGLGSHGLIDSLRVVWPNNATQLLKSVQANQTITVEITKARENYIYHTDGQRKFFNESTAPDYTHTENYENDFTRQFLLPHFYSHNGPCMAKGDVNKDGLEDIFIGGAKGQAGALFLQNKDQLFKKAVIEAFDVDAGSEDMDAVFFDADGDGSLDLYVVSGGYEFSIDDPLLQDRLYLNDGKGGFAKSVNALPKNFTNKSCVRPSDVDGDGDVDLFIGGGVVPGKYPLASPSQIYINHGKGIFAASGTFTMPDASSTGIVSCAVWIDLNKDGKDDLVLAGEWMPLKAFINHGNHFTDASQQYFPFHSKGWWNTLVKDDFDNDGDDDLVAGNYGLNSQMRVTEQTPIRLFAIDIDGNGSVDPIITHYVGGQSYPLIPRDDIIGQIPSLKKKFNDYSTYARSTIHDIFSSEQVAGAIEHSAGLFHTVFLQNNGNHFAKKMLPVEVQYSPVFTISSLDVNRDGFKDLILAGNNKYNRIYLGRHDANYGVLLLNDGHGNFKYVPQNKSGLNLKGDIRSSLTIGNQLLFGISDSPLKVYRLMGNME